MRACLRQGGCDGHRVRQSILFSLLALPELSSHLKHLLDLFVSNHRVDLISYSLLYPLNLVLLFTESLLYRQIVISICNQSEWIGLPSHLRVSGQAILLELAYRGTSQSFAPVSLALVLSLVTPSLSHPLAYLGIGR